MSLIMAKLFTLGKNERLKSRKLIDQLFAEGKKLNAGFFRMHYIIGESATHPLAFGIGVGSKTFKRAVDRNRIKRLVRESYRVQKIPLQQKLKESNKTMSVFFIYTGKIIPSYADAQENIEVAINKLLKLISK